MTKNTIAVSENSVDTAVTSTNDTISKLRGHLINNGCNVHKGCSLSTLKQFISENSYKLTTNPDLLIYTDIMNYVKSTRAKCTFLA